MDRFISTDYKDDKLFVRFHKELTLFNIPQIKQTTDKLSTLNFSYVVFDFKDLTFIDTAVAIFIVQLQEDFESKKIETKILNINSKLQSTLMLVKQHNNKYLITTTPKQNILQNIGKTFYQYFESFISFIAFFGEMSLAFLRYLKDVRKIRFKEIFFEINESSIKALGIVSLTSFLIGLVVAYQSAYQLKIYGANIFIVDMLGLSIFRELAPLITAIVIAGRSGSSYTAQIGAMKITQEIDAMRTMGFEPFAFLVLPRMIALMFMMPLLIFISDIMGIFGGMIVSDIYLDITPELFVNRFLEVIAAKHFFIGIFKGPFFAFLIASIGIYRGLMVQNDTQSIGFNTTKSVVESIFAVIVCDALFSIAFTNLGI